jgi:hypothetical protein
MDRTLAGNSPSIQAATQRQSVEYAIASSAQRTGVDFGYLMGQARIESGLDPMAEAKTSSATGLFQFTKQTWLATIKSDGAKHGYGWAADAITRNAAGRYVVADQNLKAAIFDLRKDPQAASDMAAEFAQDNAAFLSSRTGRSPESVDLYLAHFLGAGGASRFVSAHDAQPDAAAAPHFPAAARANRAIFYQKDGTARSFADIRSRFAAKLDAAASPEMLETRPTPQVAFQPFQMAFRASGSFEQNDLPQPMQFRGFEPMPKSLSIDFAAQTYRRLSALEGGRA